MEGRGLGTILVVVGLGIALVGVLVATGALSWFGRLPGDIRIEGERSRVYIPIVSMILVSVVLTLVLSLLRR
jgi:di/tricarboxylate transporter